MAGNFSKDVVNGLRVAPPPRQKQVMLKVRFAEADRQQDDRLRRQSLQHWRNQYHWHRKHPAIWPACSNAGTTGGCVSHRNSHSSFACRIF